MNGIQEVSGSIPLISTKKTPQRELWCFLRLEYERERAASADENIPETFHGFGDVFLFDLTVMPAGGG